MKKIPLINGNIYTETEIINLIKLENPQYSEAAANWKLYELKTNMVITQVGAKKYLANGRAYSYDYQDNLSEKISSFLSEKFSKVTSVVWETVQLNEWLNLLLMKNSIIVEIENGLEEAIFGEILNNFGKDAYILLEPDEKTISKYLNNKVVIVKKLYSRSPVYKKSKKIMLEKLIVDVISDVLLNSFFDTKEIANIVSGINQGYDINKEKMWTYANRRRCRDKLERILKEHD